MRRTPGACPEYQTQADMSHGDWASEVNHACFIKSPQSVIGLHTPGDLWRGKGAEYSALQFSCSRLSCNVNSQEMDKLEKRPRAIGLTTEVREGSPVTRSAFTNHVLDDRALLHGSMKTGVEAHCGAHVCAAGFGRRKANSRLLLILRERVWFQVETVMKLLLDCYLGHSCYQQG